MEHNYEWYGSAAYDTQWHSRSFSLIIRLEAWRFVYLNGGTKVKQDEKHGRCGNSQVWGAKGKQMRFSVA